MQEEVTMIAVVAEVVIRAMGNQIAATISIVLEVVMTAIETEEITVAAARYICSIHDEVRP